MQLCRHNPAARTCAAHPHARTPDDDDADSYPASGRLTTDRGRPHAATDKRGIAMLKNVWSDEVFRALVGGAGFVVLYVLLARTRWRLHRRIAGAPHQHLGLRLVADSLSVVAAVSYPSAMLLARVFSPADVGLHGAIDAQPLHLGLTALVAVCWLALNWAGSPRHDERAMQSGRRASLSGIVGSLPAALQDEFWLATSRATLIPVFGAAWGPYMAPVLHMLVANTSPLHQLALRSAPRRRLAYLDMALDWVSSAMFVLAGSLWWALSVRIVCRLLLQLTALPPAGLESHPPGELPVRWLTTVRGPLGDLTE